MDSNIYIYIYNARMVEIQCKAHIIYIYINQWIKNQRIRTSVGIHV